MKRSATIIISAILALVCLAGCGYVAGNYPPPDPTAVPDSTKTIVVNGKKYRCVNRDGSWRCESLAETAANLKRSLTEDQRYLDASHR